MGEDAEKQYRQYIDYVDDFVGADKSRSLTRVAIADIDDPAKTDGVPTSIESIGGQVQSAVDVADQIDKIQNILASQTVTVTDDGSLTIDAANQGTLPVEQQTAVAVEDTTGTGVDPVNQADATPLTGTSTAAGPASAIVLDLGALRKDVDVFYDVAIDGRIQVEVSTDNATWRPFQTINTTDSNVDQVDIAQFDTAYQYIRVYADGADFADADVNQLEASAKGVN